MPTNEKFSQTLYGYPQGSISNLYPVIEAKRDPVSTDSANITQLWCNESSNTVWMLTSNSTWTKLSP